jgi:sulfite reductase alpha subunit
MKKYDTPLLDELEKGPWPSFVTELRKASETSHNPDMANDELGQLEKSYKTKRGYWKHGGIVGVLGYGGGVIGRYHNLPEEFPGVAHFHTVRINQTSGFYYKADKLRVIMDLWDKYGSGLTNMHGSTGDMVMLGCRTEALEPFFAEVTSRGWDLGGSGSAMRTPSCCLGPSRCEWANCDTMEMTYQMTHRFQDELHRPMYPYKFKIKAAGCAVDCVAAIARSDCSIIGTWKGDLDVNNDEVQKYVKAGMNVQTEIADMCPTGCVTYADGGVTIDNRECSRCMHCVTKMSKAIKVSKSAERGFSILIGSKAPIVVGSLLSWVVVPFMQDEKPFDKLFDKITSIIEWWDDVAKPRERIGEVIEVEGMRPFLEAIGQDPIPQQVFEPRKDPFFFYSEEDLKKK